MSKHDQDALNAARTIMGLVRSPSPIGGDCQRQAQIQCLLIELLERSSTQPAAAHGDEAVVTVEQLQRWKDRFAQAQDFKFSTEVGKALAAMRAQGDGGAP